MKRLIGFFTEDNGQLSSMRLVMIWTVCLVVPGFIIACVFNPSLKDIATHVFTFAASLVGFKSYQKKAEETPAQPTL